MPAPTEESHSRGQLATTTIVAKTVLCLRISIGEGPQQCRALRAHPTGEPPRTSERCTHRGRPGRAATYPSVRFGVARRSGQTRGHIDAVRSQQASDLVVALSSDGAHVPIPEAAEQLAGLVHHEY